MMLFTLFKLSAAPASCLVLRTKEVFGLQRAERPRSLTIAFRD